MSRINGEKARAAITRKRRTAQREKDRAALALAKKGPATDAAAAEPAAKPAAKASAKAK